MTINEKATVLVVDDSSTVRNIIASHLREDFNVILAEEGEQAWQQISMNQDIVLVFADLQMPVLNGMLLLKRIRQSEDDRISQLPTIMITGHSDTEAARQASFNLGATDYISKPFSALDIISRAKSYSRLNRKIAELEKHASRDPVTDLLNEQGLQEQGDKAIAGLARHSLHTAILMLQLAEVDQLISRFADSFDDLIISVADSIKQTLRLEDSLAHLGRGRFVIVLPMTNAFKAHIVALRTQNNLINLAIKSGAEKVRLRLAVGVNSTEGQAAEITFEQLSVQTEQVLQASLLERDCKIVRYDEHIADDTGQGEAGSVTAGNFSAQKPMPGKMLSTIDVSHYSRYMAAILNGDFESIPQARITEMIEPLEAFLAYSKSMKPVLEEA